MSQMSFALILFLFPLAYSPGPGNLFFAATGARFGFRATLPANFGYHAATWLVTFALGLGLLEVIDRVPGLFAALSLAGSAYVIWLGWTLFRSGTAGEVAARPARFLDGVILLLLNPKAYVIILLMFTQFLTGSDAARFQETALITTIFTLNNMVAFVVWTILGDLIARRFRDAASARRINGIFGAILAAVGVWMLCS
jgi:threonine/homoserine/homoserine lactone efflux protein